MDEAEQRLEAIVNRRLLQHLRDRFEATGNGVHAWRAWALARSLGEAIPPWILDFVDGCADSILDESYRGDGFEQGMALEDFMRTPGSWDPEALGTAENQYRRIAEAVGLGRLRGKAALTRHALERRDRRIARRVGTLIADRGISRADAAQRVSLAFKVDRKTAAAAFDRWGPILSAPIRESGESEGD